MASHEFHLVTKWRLASLVEPVWQVLNRPEEWPQWWRAVRRVVPVREGNKVGVGTVRSFTWRTALPYEITFEMTATRIEPMVLLEGRARGELDGVGRWPLAPEGGGTLVQYDWIVQLAEPWQRILAPVLRPVFAWNHNVVMGWGYEGLCKKLGIAPSSSAS